MIRLNDRAFEILRAEVQKCSGAQKLVQVQQDIVLKRLTKLRSAKGLPASLEEVRDTIIDIIPNFSHEVLKQAVRANRPPGAFLSKLKWTAVMLTGTASALWLVNLPYPMIRLPVAQIAPILLLPSYINMDYHYRQAIAKVEQADQLVNSATSSYDLTLGEVKVIEAQKHLDNLPVWFLGYWPQYTFWFGWQFTLDEFKSARANIGRIEAKVFQEKNAQTQLQQGEQTLNKAHQQYKQGQTAVERETAIASVQAAIDQLEQVPSATLAGRTAQTKLTAAKRDFERVAGLAAGSARTGTLIDAAQQFASTASQASKNAPHSASEWSEIAQLWEQGISQLKQVPVEDPGYVEAQKFQAQYQRNLGIVRTQLEAEQASSEALARAKAKLETLWAATSDGSAGHQNTVIGQVWGIINQLQTVKSGTTAYPEAQELLQSAQANLEQLQVK